MKPTANDAKERRLVRRVSDGKIGTLVYFPIPEEIRVSPKGKGGSRARVRLASGAMISVDVEDLELLPTAVAVPGSLPSVGGATERTLARLLGYAWSRETPEETRVALGAAVVAVGVPWPVVLDAFEAQFRVRPDLEPPAGIPG